MNIIIALLFISGFFSFGILGLNFFFMKRASKKLWDLNMDENCRPKVSIIVPTYNEEKTILFKLRNLSKINYPKELIQIIVIDSNSNDNTVNLIRNFIDQNVNSSIELIIENDRSGKSAALNKALKRCKGDVIIVSDADCFLPQDILERTLPFLSDSSVGAISGPKEILNAESSCVSALENDYLNSINLIKLGESKVDSTLLFEGGFSAYKRDILRAFDPFNTGSDDCGTVIDIIQQGYRAIMVPEARFYTTFPSTLSEKIAIKIRRSGQLVKVMKTYCVLLLKKRIRRAKGTVIKNIILYLCAPFSFLLLAFCIFYLMFIYPYTALVFTIFAFPKVRNYLIETIVGYIALIIGIILCILRKKFLIWKKPQDRLLLTEDMLTKMNLI